MREWNGLKENGPRGEGIFGATENSIKCHTSIKQSSCQWTEHHQSRAGWETPFLTPDTEIKGKVHSEMKTVIIYTLSCRSKPVWLSFFSGKQTFCLPSTLRCSCPYKDRKQWQGKKVKLQKNQEVNQRKADIVTELPDTRVSVENSEFITGIDETTVVIVFEWGEWLFLEVLWIVRWDSDCASVSWQVRGGQESWRARESLESTAVQVSGCER